MVKVFCNACERQLSEQEVEASTLASSAWARENPNFLNILSTDGYPDVFCKDHTDNCHSYWSQKVERVEALSRHVSKTLRNNCRDFFNQQSKLRGVSKVANQAVS
jgi:hypothetical protein